MSTAKYWPLSMSLPFIQFGDAELTAWLDGREFTARKGSGALFAAIFQDQFERQTGRRLPPTKAAIDEAADNASHFRAEHIAAVDEGQLDYAAEAMRDAMEAEAKASDLQAFAASPARYDRQGAWQALSAALLKGEVLPSPGDAHKVASDKLPKDVDDLPDDFELFVDVASLKAKFGSALAVSKVKAPRGNKAKLAAAAKAVFPPDGMPPPELPAGERQKRMIYYLQSQGWRVPTIRTFNRLGY